MKIFKSRIIAAVLTLAMVFSVLAVPVAAADVTTPVIPEAPVVAPEVPVVAPAQTTQPATTTDAAEFLESKGLLQGDNGDLMLDQVLTREQMVVILSRLMGQEEEAMSYSTDYMTFTDVPLEDEYAPYIAWAYDNMITQGYDEETFGFGESLTAEQTKLFFVRVLGYIDLSDEEQLAKADEVGITAGSTAEETAPITRADMSLLMSNTVYTTNVDGQILGETIGVLEPEVVEPPVVVPTTLEVASAKITSDTAVNVTFNRAVADTSKITFAVTGASVLAPVATWNEAKTEATLTNASVILEGAYTVKVSGDTFAEGKDSANLVVVKNGVAKIEILSDKLVRTDDNNAQFNFKLTDSYGNDVTEKMSYDINLSTSLGNNTASLKDYKIGLVQVNKGGIVVASGWTNTPVTPELVTVTLYSKTAINGAIATANATLKVTDIARVDKVTLGSLVFPVTSPATTSVIVNKSIAAYIPMTVTDQFGTVITEIDNLAKNDSEDVFYSVGDTTVKANLTVEKYTDTLTNKDALRLVVSTMGLGDTDANKNVTIQVISKYTGSQSNVVTLALKKSSAAEKATLMSPQALVADGDTYDEGLVIPLVVIDQDGKQLTSDEIVDNANNLTITSSDAALTANLKIATSGVNKGKLVASMVKGSSKVAKGTKNVMVQVKNSISGSVSSITFEVKDAAYPRTIQLKQTPANNLLAGATTKFSYKFLDQYGRVMEDAMLSDATLVGAQYKVKFTTSNASYVTALGYADDVAGEVAASTLTADDTISVLAKATAGTTRIKAELLDKNSTTAVVSSVETALTVTEGMPSNLTYEIADVPTLYSYYGTIVDANKVSVSTIDSDTKIQAASVATTNHIVALSIVGKDASGTTYAIPQSNIKSVSTSDSGLVGIVKVGDCALKALDNKVVVYGIDNGFTTTDAANATKQATIKVVISADNGVKEVTKTVTVSKEAEKAAKIVFADKALDTDNVTSLNKDAKVLTDLAGAVGADINDQPIYVYEVDQYGVYTDVTGSVTTVNNNYYTLPTVSIVNNRLTIDQTKITANQQVFFMYTAAKGVYGTFSVRANGTLDNTAPNAPTITTVAQTVNADSITVVGTTEKAALVTITGGFATATTRADETTGAFSVAVSLSQDTVNTLSVTATDTAINVSAASTVVITEDSIAPVLVMAAQLVKPSANVTVQSNELGTVYLVPSATAAGTCDTVAELEALLAAATCTKVTIATINTNTSIVAPTTEGTYNLVAVDAAGNVSTKSANAVTVDNTAPVVVLTAPAAGAQTALVVTFNEALNATTLAIADINDLLASATNDGTAIATTTVPSSVVWSGTVNAPIATITIPSTTFVSGKVVVVNFKAAVQDVAGNSATTATVTLP